MELLEQLVRILERGGPWTVSALCILAAVHFYRELRVAQREGAKEKQDLNDRLIGMTAKQVEVLTLSNENQKQLIAAVKALED